MVENPAHDYDDEIDLREIVLTLWKKRWLILALTLIAALLAYAVSAWLLPKQYQAAAYVMIGRPVVEYQGQTNGISAVPVVPDSRALLELEKIESILDQVADDSRVASLITLDRKQLSNKTELSAVGVSLLRFRVTDTNAERAATLANVWAEKAAEWIEVNYGLGALTATLDTQISQTQQDYAQAQSALETFLAQDQRPVLQSQLNAQRDTYGCLERRVIAANALLKRLGEMETRLIPSDEPLSLSDAILLASVQQDVDSLETCGSSATILQSPSPMLFAGISSTRWLEVIVGYRQSLEQRIADTRHEQEALQEEILKLQVEIEQLGYQFAEYARQRDQAAALYGQLTYQQALVENVLQQSGRVAHVSVEAVAPQRPSSPRPAVNAVLAGMGMAVLVGAIVLLRANWSEPK